MLATIIKPSRHQASGISDQAPDARSLTPDAASEAKQREALAELEKGITAHRMSWVRAGVALAEIHARELYRLRSASFEDYLRERWNMSRRHGLDLVTAGGVAKNVREVSHSLSMRAALKLAKLPAGEQAECLSQAIAGSGSRSPPADYLAAAVAARRNKVPSPKSPKSKKSKGKSKRPRPVRLKLASGYTLTVRCNRAGGDLATLLREALAQLTAS